MNKHILFALSCLLFLAHVSPIQLKANRTQRDNKKTIKTFLSTNLGKGVVVVVGTMAISLPSVGGYLAYRKRKRKTSNDPENNNKNDTEIQTKTKEVFLDNNDNENMIVTPPQNDEVVLQSDTEIQVKTKEVFLDKNDNENMIVTPPQNDEVVLQNDTQTQPKIEEKKNNQKKPHKPKKTDTAKIPYQTEEELSLPQGDPIKTIDDATNKIVHIYETKVVKIPKKKDNSYGRVENVYKEEKEIYELLEKVDPNHEIFVKTRFEDNKIIQKRGIITMYDCLNNLRKSETVKQKSQYAPYETPNMGPVYKNDNTIPFEWLLFLDRMYEKSILAGLQPMKIVHGVRFEDIALFGDTWKVVDFNFRKDSNLTEERINELMSDKKKYLDYLNDSNHLSSGNYITVKNATLADLEALQNDPKNQRNYWYAEQVMKLSKEIITGENQYYKGYKPKKSRDFGHNLDVFTTDDQNKKKKQVTPFIDFSEEKQVNFYSPNVAIRSIGWGLLDIVVPSPWKGSTLQEKLISGFYRECMGRPIITDIQNMMLKSSKDFLFEEKLKQEKLQKKYEGKAITHIKQVDKDRYLIEKYDGSNYISSGKRADEVICGVDFIPWNWGSHNIGHGGGQGHSGNGYNQKLIKNFYNQAMDKKGYCTDLFLSSGWDDVLTFQDKKRTSVQGKFIQEKISEWTGLKKEKIRVYTTPKKIPDTLYEKVEKDKLNVYFLSTGDLAKVHNKRMVGLRNVHPNKLDPQGASFWDETC